MTVQALLYAEGSGYMVVADRSSRQASYSCLARITLELMIASKLGTVLAKKRTK